ncbi:phosphomevalonate kinase [Alkalibacterium subtropicum]|uniref:phosphomevalonate kinase n=1 Tax=Alkalibacterium subtropicum TaxID=753702 RepID=A0A1I1I003_9LACT|nr:phosphomevalonate kinase [Alkalibacterium subtropicum]SFC29759.1 phosphomevalonate kinase [Alkalibacterium subtropicum]
MKHTEVYAPGKLYIAGEYAVVEPGNPSVIVAVDRFITVSVSPSEGPSGTITSPSLSKETLHWRRNDCRIFIEEPNEKADILLKTMEMTEHFLYEQGLALPYYDIVIESTLDSSDGRKYGLGSSGAVTVASIQALLGSVGFALSEDRLFKLAAAVHVALQSRGSLGDLAAAAYTGWIAYSSPNKHWIERQLDQITLSSLIEQPWPELEVERLPAPSSLMLLVGWTGKPASTESFVASVQQKNPDVNLQSFLEKSRACVTDLISGIKSNESDQIKAAVRANRDLLLQMSRTKGLVLETPLLESLSRIAENHDAAAKTSGAGGGDCGIAFVQTDNQKERILSEWQSCHIEPLPLTVYDKHN